MKLASVTLKGRATYGALTDRGFVELAPLLAGRYKDLRELIGSEDGLRQAQQALGHGAASAESEIEFCLPIPNADARMFALGWSYKEHQKETGKEPPQHPFFFSKHPQAMVGHGKPLVRPRVSQRFDYEGEIVVVIGKAGRNIEPARAAEHIAGYAIGMDGSVRDWQLHSVTAGKNFDASSAYGPCIVTADEIPDPGAMELVTRLNGVEMQRTLFSEMAWNLGELVAYVSTFTELQPGDSISTGTPAGVGNKRVPPVYMKGGDVLEIEVSMIGVLRNPVVDEPALG